MSKLVVLSLLGGDLTQGFPVVTAQIALSNRAFSEKLTGSLPAVPELSELYRRWQLFYEAIYQGLGCNHRIQVDPQGITNVSINDFDEVCQQLKVKINAWLNCEQFQQIERQLRTLLNRNDEIIFIIETNITLLHRFPWHLWNFFQDYPKAELGLSNSKYASPQVLPKSTTGKVKILAIFGDTSGINVDKDRYLLENLANTYIEFLAQPTRKELDKYLWNQDWDILFFAGHSNSFDDSNTGKILINETESLTVSQLKNALSSAIKRGLKLAVFNSCDGIGLARNLADLNIPQIIVMREGVPDLVAQEFLKNFLVAFEGGKPFYLSVREARERLQGLENDFPCASWLPVVCQNPTTVPTTWRELCGNPNKTEYKREVSSQRKISTQKCKIWTVILITLIVTASTIGLRYLGFFEKTELETFDQMMVLRPKEEQDKRLLVVEITEEDIQSRQQESTTGLKSISDSKLATLLNKLQQYQPSVIGLDIYRDSADPPDKSNPLQLQLPTQLKEENIVVACKSRDSKYDPQGVKPPDGVPVERQGFTDAIKDPDGIVRRQILMMKQEVSSPCTTPYSLSFQLAASYLSYKNIQPRFDSNYIQFGSKIFKFLKPGNSGGYQQGVELGGGQILLNYSNAHYQRVSLQDVLSDKLNPDSVKDKVVIIGVTANTISDRWSTIYSDTQQYYQEMPGVFIQAQMVSQILNAVLESRPILWVLPYWGDILCIWGWSLASGLIVWRLRSQLNKGCAIVTTVVIIYGVCTLCISLQGLWLPFIPSVFAIVASCSIVLFIQQS